MPADRSLFRGAVGGLGSYRASVDDPGLDHPFAWPLVVFPRTTVAVRLRQVGRSGVIDATTAVLYQPGEVAEVSWIDPVDRCDYIALRPDLYESLAGQPFERPCFDRSIVPLPAGALLAVRGLVAALARNERLELLEIEETVIGVVDQVAAAAAEASLPRRATTERDRRLVDSTLAAIGADPACSGGVDHLARSVGASAAHLSRVFRRVTGRSLHAHRTELRVRRSLDELDDDLTSLALRWGFSSHSHYSERVRACMGATPTELRRRLGSVTR